MIEDSFDPSKGPVFYSMSPSSDGNGLDININPKTSKELCFVVSDRPENINSTSECVPFNGWDTYTSYNHIYYITIGNKTELSSSHLGYYFETVYDSTIYSLDLSMVFTLFAFGFSALAILGSLVASSCLSIAGTVLLHTLPRTLTVRTEDLSQFSTQSQ